MLRCLAGSFACTAVGALDLYPATAASLSRRRFIRDVASVAIVPTAVAASAVVAATVGAPSAAWAIASANDGFLPDLPPEAVRSYLQYRVPLQTAADFYVFELQDLLKEPDDYGEVNELFQDKRNRGQGNPSRIEREFTNVFRIVGLSMPPDVADEMRDAQFKFESGVAAISKATFGMRRDLPIELDPNTTSNAMAGWETGRKGINEFFAALNVVTGLNEMKLIPEAGPNQLANYGRSEVTATVSLALSIVTAFFASFYRELLDLTSFPRIYSILLILQRRYVELKKKIKLCQNRGGPTLSQTWGQLMVSGYLQDSCGIPDMDSYFIQ